jgi:hypothetical protein
VSDVGTGSNDNELDELAGEKMFSKTPKQAGWYILVRYRRSAGEETL